jgi:hypothetical protein
MPEKLEKFVDEIELARAVMHGQPCRGRLRCTPNHNANGTLHVMKETSGMSRREWADAEWFFSVAHGVGKKLATCVAFLFKTLFYFFVLCVIVRTAFYARVLAARVYIAETEFFLPKSCLSKSVSVVISRRRHDLLQRSVEASLLVVVEVRSVDERLLVLSALRQWRQIRLTSSPFRIDGCCMAAAVSGDDEVDPFLRRCRDEASFVFHHVFTARYTALETNHSAKAEWTNQSVKAEWALLAARMIVDAHRAGYTGLFFMTGTMRVVRSMWGDALLGALEADRAYKRVWLVASPVKTSAAGDPVHRGTDRLLLYRVDREDAVSFALRNLQLGASAARDLRAQCWKAFVDVGHVVYWSSFADIQINKVHLQLTENNVGRRDHNMSNASSRSLHRVGARAPTLVPRSPPPSLPRSLRSLVRRSPSFSFAGRLSQLKAARR